MFKSNPGVPRGSLGRVLNVLKISSKLCEFPVAPRAPKGALGSESTGFSGISMQMRPPKASWEYPRAPQGSPGAPEGSLKFKGLEKLHKSKQPSGHGRTDQLTTWDAAAQLLSIRFFFVTCIFVISVIFCSTP